MQYGNIAVGRFVNYLMTGGKKSTAEKVLYGSFAIVASESKQEPLAIFERAIENASPLVEVRSKRVGCELPSAGRGAPGTKILFSV